MRSRVPLLVATALLVLPACKSGSDPAGSNPAGSGPAAGSGQPPASATGTPRPAAGGSFCDAYKTSREDFTRLYFKAVGSKSPADVKAAIDGIDRYHQAWVDAAPPELTDDFRVLVPVWRGDREAAERAGWSSLAYVRAIADDLDDKKYLDATEHVLAYLTGPCHMDLTEPFK
jgi:hypothetical protein